MGQEVPDYFESKKQTRQTRKNSLFSRRSVLKTLTLFIPPLAGWSYSKYESGWLDLSKQTVPLQGLKKEENLKLLHISDLHLSKTFSLDQIETALRRGLSASPDACFITGDFITSKPSQNEFQALGNTLSKFSSKIPTYACLGNHDGGSWASSHGGFATSEKIRWILQKARVRLLVNERVTVKIKGIPLQIVGVGDFWSKECNPRLCMTQNSQNPPGEPVILMCHNPDAKDILKPFFWNLMLAGHTHGGQFVVPFTKFAPFAPVTDKSIVEGLHSWDKSRYIHVTKGVGNLYGLRFNCRPEISLIELVAK